MTAPLPDFRFSRRAQRTGPQPISFLMAQAVDNPDVISLAAGLVDYDTLPLAETAQVVEAMLQDPAAGRRALQYGTTAGSLTFRTALLHHMAALDGVDPVELDATPDDVVVTTGSQQLLLLLTELLVDPGDIVVTAWPSYFVYSGVLETIGARVRGVDVDDDGVVPESLEALLQRIAGEGELRRVKIVYLVSYHQNPTGLTLSAERRPQVLQIVQRYSAEHRILLLEDAAYRELTYGGHPPPSIRRFDTTGAYVALAQTFSKPFSPGLKVGYGLLPRDLVEPLCLQKGNHDFGSANFNQQLLLRTLESGSYAAHVTSLCDHYRSKRDAMLTALREHLDGVATWTTPSGGLYVYLTLPTDMDASRDSRLFSRAVGNGVLYVPGVYCFGPDETRTKPTHTMRLSFGVPTAEQIREGVRRLAAAIHEERADR